MSALDRPVQTFDIEGQEVNCYLSDGHRLWQCPCADFQRTLMQYAEGFCPHTAVAILRALQDGSISISVEGSTLPCHKA
jgi:hypothetical protein